MKIQVYAILKDFFEKEFTVSQAAENIGNLKEILIEKNPAAKNILDISRFAVNNTFVELDYTLSDHDNISIMPPSSGG